MLLCNLPVWSTPGMASVLGVYMIRVSEGVRDSSRDPQGIHRRSPRRPSALDPRWEYNPPLIKWSHVDINILIYVYIFLYYIREWDPGEDPKSWGPWFGSIFRSDEDRPNVSPLMLLEVFAAKTVFDLGSPNLINFWMICFIFGSISLNYNLPKMY